jgi:hypothetical protein
MQPLEEVAPGPIAAMHGAWKPPDTEGLRRLRLADWLAAPEHPRTARMMVNRAWHYHFGAGLVATPNDLGWHGGAPSHPELLDWLAARFVADGYSLKSLHRRIMLSATYRQSSRFAAQAAAADAANRWLWRYAPRRLEAEPLRDSMLYASGKLDLRMQGPGYDAFEPNSNYVKVYTPKTLFGPLEWRRMVYESKARMEPDPTFGAFDCPDAAASLARRNVSTTALQALNLLNSPFVVEQAEFFAQRVVAIHNTDVDAQIVTAFRLALGRPPDAIEERAARELVDGQGLAELCRALFNCNEFLYVY